MIKELNEGDVPGVGVTQKNDPKKYNVCVCSGHDGLKRRERMESAQEGERTGDECAVLMVGMDENRD